LLQHKAINQAYLVGVQDDKYGESVSAFLQLRPGQVKPTLEEIRNWMRAELAPQKAPTHLFWIGPGESVEEYPMTGSGKIRKEILRGIGDRLVHGVSDRRVLKL